LGSILKDEERHLDWLEAQLDQIDQVGLQNYLLGQSG
jgi:bacterioferritin